MTCLGSLASKLKYNLQLFTYINANIPINFYELLISSCQLVMNEHFSDRKQRETFNSIDMYLVFPSEGLEKVASAVERVRMST